MFENTAVLRLPDIDAEGVSGRVVIGDFQGLRSPVRTDSETLYADLRLAPGASVKIPADAEERAIYTLEGEVSISGDIFPAERLLVFRPGDEIIVSSQTGAHFMLFGGASLGSKRYIWWNFVSSSKERIEQAKQEWKTGRFDIVPGDKKSLFRCPKAEEGRRGDLIDPRHRHAFTFAGRRPIPPLNRKPEHP